MLKYLHFWKENGHPPSLPPPLFTRYQEKKKRSITSLPAGWSLSGHFLPAESWGVAMCPLVASSGSKAPVLNEILLWVFTADVVRVSLVAEGKVLAVFLFDVVHFLVLIRLFPSAVELRCDTQDGQNDKDHHCDDSCKTEDNLSGGRGASSILD